MRRLPRSGSRPSRGGVGRHSPGPADFTKLYGSASAIFAFLFSVYLSATAFVLGAIFTAVLHERFAGAPPADSE